MIHNNVIKQDGTKAEIRRDTHTKHKTRQNRMEVKFLYLVRWDRKNPKSSNVNNLCIVKYQRSMCVGALSCSVLKAITIVYSITCSDRV